MVLPRHCKLLALLCPVPKHVFRKAAREGLSGSGQLSRACTLICTPIVGKSPHFLPERIEGCVQFCFDLQSRSGSCMTNQFHDDLTIEQRTTTPVLRDLAEQAMLDLVPLARPWWEMANAHRQPQPVRQLFAGTPFHKRQRIPLLPPPSAVISNRCACGKRWQLHPLPPTTDARHRKLYRVVINAHAHPALIVRQVVNPVRESALPSFLSLEVVTAYLRRLTGRAPLTSGVLEIAQDSPLLFAIARRSLAAVVVAKE